MPAPLLLVLACLTPAAAPPAARRDVFGDLLPDGAIARMGTTRLRTSSLTLAAAFALDGKTVASAGDGRLEFWDVRTGKLVRSVVPSKGSSHPPFQTCEGGELLLFWGDRWTFRVLDGRAASELPRLAGQHDSWEAFSPDGGTALLSEGTSGDLLVYDVGTARLRCRIAGVGGRGDRRPPVAFLPDGKAFVTRWTDGKLRLIGAADGKVLRHLEPDADDDRTVAWRVASLAVTPDGKHVVYRLSADRAVRVREVATGKRVRQWDDDAEPRLQGALLTDGRRVYGESKGCVRVWDFATGEWLREVPAGRGLYPFALSPDGKTVAEVTLGALILRNATTGELLHDAGHVEPVRELAFSGDGRRLATLASDGVRVWDAASGKEVGRYARQKSDELGCLRWSGDAVRWIGKGRVLYQWKPGGREAARLTVPKLRWTDGFGVISPTGEWQAVIQSPLRFRLLSLLDSRERLLAESNECAEYPGVTAVFSPDGGVVALVMRRNKKALLFDSASGEKLCEFTFEEEAPWAAAFAPDGRSLLLQVGETRLYEVATGGVRLQLPKGDEEHPFGECPWSPDGRFVARWRKEGLSVFDVYAGKQTWKLSRKLDLSSGLAFSPDGRRLAIGDGSAALVWPLPAPAKLRSPLGDAQAWRDLGDADAEKGFVALRHFVVESDAGVKWLAENLRLPAAPDPKRVALLIAQLDDETFDRRQEASRELEKIGHAAWPALRKAMEGSSPEVRKRGAALLAKPRFGSPERLRILRAIEALERIGTPAAKALLEKLLAQKPAADWRAELQATLARLGVEGDVMTAALLISLACLTPAAAPPAARLDTYGDPLPFGAVARMGTTRLRFGHAALIAFAPDGKTLAAAGRDRIAFFEVPTGRHLRTVTVEGTQAIHALRFSGQGNALAVSRTKVKMREDEILVLDARTGRPVAGVPVADWNDFRALSPDGKTALLIDGDDVLLWDVAAARARCRIADVGGEAFARPPAAFLPDGKAFVMRWTDSKLHLVSAETGKSIRDLEPDARRVSKVAWRIASVAVTPDGNQAVYRLDEQPGVHVVDVATGKRVRSWQDDENGSIGSALTLTADAGLLVETRPQSLRVWDFRSGKRLRDVRRDEGKPCALSPDGKTIARATASVVSLHDFATDKPLHQDAGHVSRVRELAFSTDDKWLVTLAEDSVRTWDATSGRELARLDRPNFRHFAWLRWDGTAVRWIGSDRTMYQWREGERAAKQLTSPHRRKVAGYEVVSSDGQWAAGLHRDSTSLLLGSLLRPSAPRVLATYDRAYDGDAVYFSPDGRSVALVAASEGGVLAFDVATGEQTLRLSVRGPLGTTVHFSPDGRSLLVFGDQGRIYEVATGGERVRLPSLRTDQILQRPEWPWWSPDGRLVACALTLRGVSVFDTLTGKELWRHERYRNAHAIAISDDRRRLAFATDTAVLTWPLPSADDAMSPLDDEKAWEKLGDADAKAGLAALRHFVGDPDAAVRWFAEHLRLPTEVGEKHVARLVERLDDEDFDRRTQADGELARIGPAAWPALREALKSRSPEVRKRAAGLLAKPRFGSPERLRLLRAIEALERIGTPAARALLENLLASKPAPDWRAEIDATLARLRARGR